MAQQKTARKTGGKGRATTKSMKKAATSRRPKAAVAKRNRTEMPSPAGDEEVSIDRRRNPRRGDEQAVDEASPASATLERRQKVNRRRQIDPTTCERDYTENEVEFMNALDDYKRKSGRMFPTCSEVLEVIRALGYIKLSSAEMVALPGGSHSAASAKPMPNDWSSIAEGHPSPLEPAMPSLNNGQTAC